MLDEATKVTIPPQGRQRLPRTAIDMKGVVNLYVDDGEAVATRSATLGQAVTAGKSTKQPSRSAQLAPIVHLAAQSGSVLTVHATKIAAERLAAELASGRAERSEAMPVVRLAEQRLGDTHPLVSVLRSGVAYHHAALPSDVQAEIEGAVRSGAIEIVCATTTLTEGINLPVRTVIVCERGFYDGTKFHQFIDSADLMNAAGRAGRAGRETEGWVVINYEFGATSPRQALRELDKQHDIRSTLNVESAVTELEEYEALVHATAVLVLADVPPVVDGFLAYCWYLADVADVLNPDDRRAKVIEGIRHTLAWQQLPTVIQTRWEALAERVAVAYEGTEPTKRRRWARSGARLSANAVLEAVAQGVADAVGPLTGPERNDPVIVLGTILGEGRFEQLLGLVQERDYRFKRKRYGPTELVAVDVGTLVLDWVRGVPLADLVASHLGGVDATEDDGYRFEQLSTFLTRVCEHHLPFVLGTILEWINADLVDELCPALPAHVHFGVADTHALELLMRGVRSRRLAVVVGERARAAGIESGSLKSWLTDLGAQAWRTEFEAGAAEVGDLLQFVHDPTAAIGGALLDGETVRVALDPATAAWGPIEELAVSWSLTDDSPRPLVITNGSGEIVGTIRAAEHRHLAVLADAGFQLLASPGAGDDSGVTEINLRADLD